MLAEYARRYRHNLLESVVPFWMRHSLDHEMGGYFTCLDRDGTVYDTRKYVWMQGRAVWMFSRLYNQLERRQEWLDAATLIVRFIRRFARDPQGRYYFSLTRDGKPVFYQRKPYAAFFAVLAFVEYYKTGAGGPEYLEDAAELFWKVREWIRNPALLDRPMYGPPMSQLADIMVEASMALELMTVDPDPRYAGVLRECLAAVRAHYDVQRGILLENVAPRELPEGRLFCPGSAVETAWFLLRVLQRLPDAPLEKLLLDVIEASLEYGWDNEYGGLYYFRDVDGKPPAQLEASMKLWWPHTEAIYALVLAWTRTRESRWLRWLARIDDYTFRHFVDEEYGEWFGYLDRQGNRTHSLKGGSYKGFFHVPRCLLFSIQAIEGAE
ncbi:MAG: AGE family epimerase/isomerase [Acidobacteria bacterium]|nr:AGE family epimerase/isomerase [Acidobacteriota bacterium]